MLSSPLFACVFHIILNNMLFLCLLMTGWSSSHSHFDRGCMIVSPFALGIPGQATPFEGRMGSWHLYLSYTGCRVKQAARGRAGTWIPAFLQTLHQQCRCARQLVFGSACIPEITAGSICIPYVRVSGSCNFPPNKRIRIDRMAYGLLIYHDCFSSFGPWHSRASNAYLVDRYLEWLIDSSSWQLIRTSGWSTDVVEVTVLTRWLAWMHLRFK